MALSGSLSTNKYSGIMGLKFSWTAGTQSIVDNTTPISWTLESDGGSGYSYYTGNLTLTIDGSTALSIPSRFLMDGGGAWKRTGTLTLKHNDDGNRSFSVSIAAGIYTWGAVNCTASTTFTLDQIKRRSVISGSNGTLGSANTLKLTRYNSAFTDTITAVCGTASTTIASSSTASSVTWMPPIDWAAQNASATSVTVTVTCKTYSGSTLLGETSTTLTFAIPESVVPTVSLTVSDAKGYLAAYGSYIQNKSQAAVKASGKGVYGSSIKSYTIVCGSLSGTGSELTFELPSSGKITVKVTATDSRGRSASASTTIDVIAYSAPMAEITSRYRCDANGNEDYLGAYAIAFFNAAVTSLGGRNGAAYALKYRVRGTTAWTSISMDALSGNYAPAASQIFPAGIDNSYDVCIAVTDNFGTIESAYRTVQLGSPIMDVDRDNRALGFFQRAVDANTVAFGSNVKFNAGCSFSEPVAVRNSIDAAEALVYKFTPLNAKDTAAHKDLLNIMTNGDFTSGNMHRTYIGVEDASTLINSPIGAGAFYAIREVETAKNYYGGYHTLVTLREFYPVQGRVWTRMYDINAKIWYPIYKWQESYPNGAHTIPAMVIGTEYALEEYYNGSQIYAKWVDFGALPSSGYKTLATGISPDKYVSILGTMYTSQDASFRMFPNYYSGNLAASAFINSGSLIVVEVFRDMSQWTAKFLLKYIK